MTLTQPNTGISPIPFARTPLATGLLGELAAVLDSGWLTSGPQVAAFEDEFGQSVCADHAVAVSSCTAGLELALRALRLPEGSKVLTPTITFCGAVNAILHAGHVPVFVDADAETLMPNAATTAAAVARAGQPDAMVVLHFAGFPAPVHELANAAGLPLNRVIEDAAHAVGTHVGTKPVGTLSAATCFSFYATKNLPIGEGGMVTTDDEDVAEFVRRARLHGMSRDAWKRYLPGAAWRYEVSELGMKANMTDIQAAIGRSQLRQVPAWQARRAEVAARYDRLLADVPGIATPARPRVGVHGWHLYVIRVRSDFPIGRDALMARLNELGIGTSVHFIPNHRQPLYLRLIGDHVADHCPVADDLFDQVLSLPFHPGLSDDEVERVAGALRSFAEGGRTGTNRYDSQETSNDRD